MQEATQELDFAAPEIQHPRCAESLQRLDHQAATTLMRRPSATEAFGGSHLDALIWIRADWSII
jgi:hypothetical protein